MLGMCYKNLDSAPVKRAQIMGRDLNNKTEKGHVRTLSVTDFREVGFVQQHGALLVRLSSVLDVFLIFLALRVVSASAHEEWSHTDVISGLTAVVLFHITTTVCNLYRSWRLVRLRDEALKVLIYWTIAFALTLLIQVMNVPRPPGSLSFLNDRLLWRWFVVAYLAMLGLRVVARILLHYRRATGRDLRRVAFAGCNAISSGLSTTFARHRWMGITVAGYFDDRSPQVDRPVSPVPTGSFKDLIAIAQRGEISAVYICLRLAAENRVKTLIDGLANSAVSIYYCPSFFDFDLCNARWDDVFGQPVVSIVDTPFVGYERWLKRAEDVALALLIVPVAVLPMLVIALLIACTSPGPVFFRQDRYGLGGKKFKIWKFRTMYQAVCQQEFRQALPGDARVTRLGRLLRRTSLDELPQLFNVIRGDMSFIGPRPHPVELDETHRNLIHRYMLRHKVKPGITGLAQVSGLRGETTDARKMRQRVEHDLRYIRGWSVALDLWILLMTVRSVVFGQNAH